MDENLEELKRKRDIKLQEVIAIEEEIKEATLAHFVFPLRDLSVLMSVLGKVGGHPTGDRGSIDNILYILADRGIKAKYDTRGKCGDLRVMGDIYFGKNPPS